MAEQAKQAALLFMPQVVAELVVAEVIAQAPLAGRVAHILLEEAELVEL